MGKSGRGEGEEEERKIGKKGSERKGRRGGGRKIIKMNGKKGGGEEGERKMRW